MEGHQLKGVAALALEQRQVLFTITAINSTTDICKSNLPTQSCQVLFMFISLSFQAGRTGRLSTSSEGRERSNQEVEPQPLLEQL